MITVHAPEVRRDGDRAYLRSSIENFDRGDALWYSVPLEYADVLAVGSPDAFVIGLLPAAMEEGRGIVVKGSLSERLFYNLTNYLMPILEGVRPELSTVEILPDDLTLRRAKGPAVASGFSGGIDSFSVLADHFIGSVPQGYRLTHLLFNNVGAHGPGPEGQRAFEWRRRALLPAVQELGLPLITIESNIDQILTGRFDLTHTIRNVSAAHALQSLIGKFLYASCFRYEDVGVHPAHDIAYADPLTVHLLSTEGTECISTGSQYSRVEKTERLTQIELSHRYLDVCLRPEDAMRSGKRNCSACKKCVRALLTLEILGKAQLYHEVFDLDGWRRRRSRHIARHLARTESLAREVVDLARRRRFSLPLSSRLEGTAWRLAHDMKLLRAARSLRSSRRNDRSASASS
jgi:hypothetical protein